MHGYVNFTRFLDVASSLEELNAVLSRVPTSEIAWKFAIIAGHSALQGSLAMALRGGNAFQTWRPKQLRKWLDAYDRGEELNLPDPQLDVFMELFDRAFSESAHFDRDLISWLNDTRNGLVHFNTDSYSIGRESMIASLLEAVDAISHTPEVAIGSGVFFYEPDEKERFERLCDGAKVLLNGLRDA